MGELEQLLKTTTEHFEGIGQHFGSWGRIYRKGHGGNLEEFTPAEKKELRKLARRRSFPRGFCYMNAQKLAHDTHDDDRFKYMEGLVSVHGVPIDHAWIEFNGKVFDPTLFSLKTFQPKSGIPGEYWGMEVRKELIWKHQWESKTYSPLTGWPSTFAEELLK